MRGCPHESFVNDVVVMAVLSASHDTDRPLLAAIHGKDKTLVDGGNSMRHAVVMIQEMARLGWR
ncbi:hypothetical protein [Sulfobacillus harzensis]|uniref:Uncharacterized protein n=1 Tax=Sulfobacillus harzensis TaxID=2729629 RepID=A0A7Y0L4G6_9FIRM|nr:hypothetical protein [Sulfobacillus harzensis]NMP23138.1 hypothetical protein [Sulfobacillus harzensis]